MFYTKKTKIICTISDLRCDVKFLTKLYESGMNIVRINSAHATVEGAQKIVDNVRAVSDKIGILVDTKGPEVRLTAMADDAGEFEARQGDWIEIHNGPDRLCKYPVLYTNYANFVSDVPVGSHVLIDDGAVDLFITGKDNDKYGVNPGIMNQNERYDSNPDTPRIVGKIFFVHEE